MSGGRLSLLATALSVGLMASFGSAASAAPLMDASPSSYNEGWSVRIVNQSQQYLTYQKLFWGNVASFGRTIRSGETGMVVGEGAGIVPKNIDFVYNMPVAGVFPTHMGAVHVEVTTSHGGNVQLKCTPTGRAYCKAEKVSEYGDMAVYVSGG